MGLKIGICGLRFGGRFVRYFQEHPLVEAVYIADLLPERLNNAARKYGIATTFRTLDELLASDIDALGLFTQEWTHAPLAMRALRLGKHVYSAVPAAVTVEEMAALIETVRETGRTYMVGETSYYYATAIYCRERFARGDFGKFVYGEADYLHDMEEGLIARGQASLGDDWKRFASNPPMLYATHATNLLLSVTGARFTHTACLGRVDDAEDGLFDPSLSAWGNPFSNQTALMRTSDGGMARINSFRRIGWAENKEGNNIRLSLFGTRGSYEEQTAAKIWMAHSVAPKRADRPIENLRPLLDPVARDAAPDPAAGIWPGMAAIHPRERLPASYINIPNGHEGSHPFLVDDFVRACDTGRLPPNHVWSAARDCVPGMIAHESSQRGGEMLPIPDFGDPPADAARLSPVIYAH
jgi:predicted dehydrogenase